MYGKLTEEQRLQKAVIAIMAHPRYLPLAGIMMIGKREITDNPRIKTACTNGRDEFYDRAFVAKLRDSELRFLVLHEVFHKMYKHLITWLWMYKEDADRANKACDYVINVQLVDENAGDGFATMTGALQQGCLDPKYRGWDSAAVFRDLKTNPRGGGKGGQGGEGEPLDMHDWDGAQELTAEEKQELTQEIDEALRQGVLAASKVGSGGARDFEDLLTPQRNWREDLREFVSQTCAGSDYSTWKKPNRRYVGMGIYMPSGISESIGEGVIANDMSGSIGNAEIQVMLSEVAEISKTVKPSALHILYWDTQVCAAEKYEQHELDKLIQSTKPAGGGGTDVECVPAYMHEHRITPQFAIVFTDGHLGGGWGHWPCPVLWVIVDNKGCVPPFGTCIHVTTSQLHS